MKKMYVLSFLVLVLFLADVCSGASWQTVVTFTEQGSRVTDDFYVPTTEWRIIWNYTVKSWQENYTMFGFLVFPKGGTNIVSAVMCQKEEDPTSGVTYVYKGAQYFYLSIYAQFVENYTIRIEYNTSPSPTPTQTSTDMPEDNKGSNLIDQYGYLIIGAVVSIVVVGAVFIVYFKKRSHSDSREEKPLKSS